MITFVVEPAALSASGAIFELLRATETVNVASNSTQANDPPLDRVSE
jgi:hypothetical protein